MCAFSQFSPNTLHHLMTSLELPCALSRSSSMRSRNTSKSSTGRTLCESRSMVDLRSLGRRSPSPTTNVCVPVPHLPLEVPTLPSSTVAQRDAGAPVQNEITHTATNNRRGVELVAASPHYFMETRYRRRGYIAKDAPGAIEEIEAMSISFDRKPLGWGWTPKTHPEGQLYFQYENFFTDLDLYESETLKDVEELVTLLRAELIKFPNLPEDLEIGLDMDSEGGRKFGYYYFSSEKTRSIFWLAKVDTYYHTCDMRKVFSQYHIKDAQEATFWRHLELFPQHRVLSKDVQDEIDGLLLYHAFDSKTSRTSTAPWSSPDLLDLIQIVKEVRGKISSISPERSGPFVFVIARTMHYLARERFLHYHGQVNARLDRDRSVHEDPSARKPLSLTFRSLSWLLFFTPDVYFERLRKIWVDESVNYQHWNDFITELQEDWRTSITPTAVILTANVGLLAVQSIDRAASARTPTQILIYASTLLSIGNIITSTILSRQHRLSTQPTAEYASKYLGARAENQAGMERVAITFSIPAALFMWSMLGFCAAVAYVCFHETSVATWVFSGLVVMLVSALVAWVVYYGDWSEGHCICHSVARHLRDKLRRMVFSGVGDEAPDEALKARRLNLFQSIKLPQLTRRRKKSTMEDADFIPDRMV